MQDAQTKATEHTLESVFRDILAVNDHQADKWDDGYPLKNILGHSPTIGEIRALVRQSEEARAKREG